MTRALLALFALFANIALALLAVPARGDEAGLLHDLFAREWENRLREDPLLATSVGRNEWNDRLPRVAPADLARQVAATRAFLAELDAIDEAKLPDADRVSAGIFRRQLKDGLADYELGDYQMPFNADSGFHTGFARLPEDVPLLTVKDYDNYVARLRDWPRYVGEQIELMRQGIERGMTVPRAVLDG